MKWCACGTIGLAPSVTAYGGATSLCEGGTGED